MRLTHSTSYLSSSTITVGDILKHISETEQDTDFPISSKAEIWRVYFQNLLPAGRLVLVSILPSAGSLLLNLFTNNLCFRADGKLSRHPLNPHDQYPLQSQQRMSELHNAKLVYFKKIFIHQFLKKQKENADYKIYNL